MDKTLRLAALALALVVAGCATPPAIDATLLPAAPAQFKEGDGRWTVAAPAEAQPRGEWWKAFRDPVLDDLVAAAERSNASIQAAAARLAQARAIARLTDADRAPQAGIAAGASRAGGIVDGSSGPARSFGSAGASLSYELDLFGKLTRAADAARLDAQASQGLLQSTRLLVQAEVAQTYLALRALDVERALVRGTVNAYRGTLDMLPVIMFFRGANMPPSPVENSFLRLSKRLPPPDPPRTGMFDSVGLPSPSDPRPPLELAFGL